MRCILIAVGIVLLGGLMPLVLMDLRLIYINTAIAALLTLLYSIYKHTRNPIRLFILWFALWIIIPVFVVTVGLRLAMLLVFEQWMVFALISGFLGFLALFLFDYRDSLKGETAKGISYILGLIFMGGMILGFVMTVLTG